MGEERGDTRCMYKSYINVMKHSLRCDGDAYVCQQKKQQGQRPQPAQQRPAAPQQRGAPAANEDAQRNTYRVPAPGQPGAPGIRGKVPGLQEDANQPMDGFMC